MLYGVVVRVSKYTSGISANALAAWTHPDYASLVGPPLSQAIKRAKEKNMILRLSQKHLTTKRNHIKFCNSALCEFFVFIVVNFLTQRALRIHEGH